MCTAKPYKEKTLVQLCHPKKAHLGRKYRGEMDDYINALQSQRGFGYSKGPSESLPQSMWVDIRINKDAVGTEEMNMS